MIDEYFQTARERHAIYLRRKAGDPFPWTSDPIFQKYRFCNVFREFDTTTQWFRKYVRDPLRNKPEVLLATVVFRLFNRISTAEAIFMAPSLDTDGLHTAWDRFLRSPDVEHLRGAALKYCGDGPYVTGSYMIKTPTGMNKLDGVLHIIGGFSQIWRILVDSWYLRTPAPTLQSCWEDLRQFPFIGDFTAYEIVTDLRWTALLENAPDINTWANAGPGAKKGLARLTDLEGDPLAKMQQLLQYSRLPEYWPKEWPVWELREAEMWSCEYEKYSRVKEGGAPPRQRFKHA